MPDFTTTALLSSIRRRALIPTSASAGRADSDLLSLATERLWGELSAWIKSMREEFFVVDSDATITANQNAYNIPARAMGGSLRDVIRLDSSSTTFNLRRLDPTGIVGLDATTGTPVAFYLKGSQVILWPTPDGTGDTLRLSYFRRAGALVATTAVGVVASLSAGAKTVTLSTTKPSTFLTTASFDFVAANPGFRTLGIDLVCNTINVTAPTAPVFTMTAALPTDLAVGDYLCLAGESPVPQVPPEYHQLLAQMTAVATMEQAGKGDEVAMGQQRVAQMKSDFEALSSPRVDGEVQTLTQDTFFPYASTSWFR